MPSRKVAPAAVLLAALLTSLSPATASTVLSLGAMKARADVIVVGKGDFSDLSTPLTGTIRPSRVLKGVRQAQYRIVITNDFDPRTDLPPPWLPTQDHIKATFYLGQQEDGRYYVMGTENEK